MTKKLLFTLLLLLGAISLVFAENAFWVGNAPYGADWTDDGLYAFTDLYLTGSSVSVSSETSTVIVTVIDSLPETLEGRDFGLSRGALESLGIWGQGTVPVSVRLRSGAIAEDTTEPDLQETGWYLVSLGEMTAKEALDLYKTLAKNGYKPSFLIKESSVTVQIPYLVEYELEDTLDYLEKLGLEATVENGPNPYL